MKQWCRLFLSITNRLISNGSLRSFKSSSILRGNVYTNEERCFILKKINERDIPSKALPSTQIENLHKYLERQQFSSLEELLNVKGIGPKGLRKFCDRILEVKEGKTDTPPLKKPKDFNIVNPPITDAQKQNLVQIVAVHIGSGNISWVLVDSLRKSLIEWRTKEYIHEKRNIFELLKLSEDIVSEVPVGDIYIMEDVGQTRMHLDYCRNQLMAMILSFLHAARINKSGDSIVALLKPSMKYKIYNGIVGSEKVSLQQHVVEMIKERCQSDCLSFPSQLSDRYFSQNSNTREDMAQSLLLATSFINVILNQRNM